MQTCGHATGPTFASHLMRWPSIQGISKITCMHGTPVLAGPLSACSIAANGRSSPPSACCMPVWQGIGLEISKALRTQGMTVVMTARNEQMGNDAKGKVEALEGVSRVLAEVAGGDTTGEMFAAFSRGHDGLLLLQEQSLMDIDIGKNVMAIPKNGALCCWGLAVRRADIVQPSTPCEPLVSMLLCSTRLLSRFHVRCNPSLP
eukprot:364604-Chlamydomonas_euryale.AAC.23